MNEVKCAIFGQFYFVLRASLSKTSHIFIFSAISLPSISQNILWQKEKILLTGLFCIFIYLQSKYMNEDTLGLNEPKKQ